MSKEPKENVAMYCSECTAGLLNIFQEKYLPNVDVEPGDFVKTRYKQKVDGKEEAEWMWGLVLEEEDEGTFIVDLHNQPVICTAYQAHKMYRVKKVEIRNVIKEGTQNFVMDEEQEGQSLSHAH